MRRHLRLLAFCLVVVWPTLAYAEGLSYTDVQTDVPQTVKLAVGSSLVVESPAPFTRASIANPDTADAMVLSPTQMYLTGKAFGSTTLTLWGKDKKVSAVFHVQVAPDVSRLKTQLHQVFPEEKNIQVTAGHDNLSLSGDVSGAGVLAKVLAIAEPYAPKKVVNLLQVSGVQQVMLEVHVAEMNRALMRQMGINFSRVRPGTPNFSIGTLNDLSSFTRDSSGLTTLTASALTNAVFGFGAGKEVINVFLDFLKQHNLSKILAEPTLVAISGQEAEFLAGGEIPIPIPQSFGVTTIKFKKFGVRLGFAPTILSGKKISLKIQPEVSELDFSNAIMSQGISIPAFTTRRVGTVLELDDGQSFAIAGLLQENIRETVAKYPVLGDIPILGTLFRSTSFQKNETELIIIVTPHIVKPLDLATQTLPTDAYLEPNDFELMLLGYLEGVPPQANARSLHSHESPLPVSSTIGRGGGLEGTFGHLALEGSESIP